MRRLIAIILVFMLFVPGIVFGKMKKDAKPKHQLKTIFMKDLKKPVRGDVRDAALKSVEDLMKPKGVRFKKDKNRVTGFRLKNKKVKADKLGHKHIRLLQYYNGLPVIGGELIVHVNEKGIIHRINGMYLSPIDISVEPTIDGDVAVDVGLAELQGKHELRVTKEPSLVVYDSHLTWHFVISHEGPDLGRWWYYVDAHTGEVILRYNNIKNQNCYPTWNGDNKKVTGSRLAEEGGGILEITGWLDDDGKYYLYNGAENWGIFDEDAACWERNNTSDWGSLDPAAISAGYNFSLTQTWVNNVLGRDSYDGEGSLAKAIIHYTFDNSNNGACWDWDFNFFAFGDGDNIEYGAFTTLDVVAHEFGHAITDANDVSQLQYYGESGALNESYSDIMAAAVEFSCQQDGRSSYPGSIPGRADWLCGEDVTLHKEAMRDMKDPNTFGHPSYYGGTHWNTSGTDLGGVHINCGVQNFAFYLLAEGGEGINDGQPYNITGIGINNAIKVAMSANINYLTSTSQFIHSRQAWIAAAEDFNDPNIPVSTIEAVWDAVGVFEHQCDYDEEFLDHTFSEGERTRLKLLLERPYDLPFDFPFYGKTYNKILISSAGYIDFVIDTGFSSVNNITSELIQNIRIAPLWTKLCTDPWHMKSDVIYDVFVHQPDPNSFCIYWKVYYLEQNQMDLVKFEVILYADGRIQFNYGESEATFDEQPPTIGISAGDGIHYCISANNQTENTSYMDSILFTPIPEIIQEIPLNTGWNLISFQIGKCFYQGTEPTVFIPTGTEKVNIPSLKAWLSDDLTSPIRDAADPSKAGNWQRITSMDAKGAYCIDKDSSITSLKYLSIGYGYHVKMNAPGYLILEGRPLPPDTPIELRYGWNFIGPISIDTCYADIDQGSVCPYNTGIYKPEENIQYSPVNTVASVFSSIDGEYRKYITSSDSCSGEILFDTQAPYSDNTLHYIGPKYGYKIKIENPDGGTLVFPDPVLDFQKISLNAGWNLISFQVGKCFYQGTEPTVFIPAGTEKVNIASLKTWLSDDLTSPLRDAADPSKAGNWRRIISFAWQDDDPLTPIMDTQLPAVINSLKFLSVGYGYHILMDAPGYLILEGEPLPADTPLVLHDGWNLIGPISIDTCYGDVDQGAVCPYVTGIYKPEEAIRYCPVDLVSSVFSAIDGQYRRVTSSDYCSGEIIFDVLYPPSDNTLHYIGPKHGYWIMIENPSESTLVFPGGCPQF